MMLFEEQEFDSVMVIVRAYRCAVYARIHIIHTVGLGLHVSLDRDSSKICVDITASFQILHSISCFERTEAIVQGEMT